LEMILGHFSTGNSVFLPNKSTLKRQNCVTVS
jgi:hypothetical protein